MRKTVVLFLLILIVAIPVMSDNSTRLLVLGDSLSIGLYATSEQNGFKHILANQMGADLASCRGSNLQYIVDCWDKYQVWEPDTVVIEIGLNDVSNFNGLALPESEWITMYSDFVADIQATGAQAIVTTLFHGRPAHHPLYPDYERYNGHIANIAATHGAVLADVWEATKHCVGCISQPGVASPWSPGWAGDNFHPSDVGHQVIADTIHAAIPQTLFLPMVGGNQGYP